MSLPNDLLRRLRRRVPVVPRATRDAVEADVAELRTAVSRLLGDYERLDGEYQAVLANTFVPPGHFYSPVPPVGDALAHVERVMADRPPTLAGIDLRL